MKNLKKLSLLLISFFVSGIVIVLACAGGEWDDTEGSMFTPEIINKPKYQPFFRAADYPLYDGYYENMNQVCNELNLKEWEKFFEGKVDAASLNYWLNRASGKEIGEMLLITKGKGGTINDSSRQFTLAPVQPIERVNAFLFYLGFAKRNERFACGGSDADEKENPNIPTLPKQIEGGLKLLANVKTDFLKERYFFQLTRLYYFNGQYKEAIAFYDANKNSFKTGNSMKWRAMGYVAAAQYKSKNFSGANYYYSLIYDGFDPHRKSAYLSFHPQNDADWEACLQLAKTTREKNVLWQLFGIYFDGPRAMEEIYKADPASDLLDLLLARAINIAEEKSGGPQISRYGEEEKPFSTPADEKLLAFVSKVATENKTSNDALWDLAAAHLNYCNRNFAAGDKFLSEAKKTGNKNDLFAAQLNVVSLFGKLNRETKLDENAEKKFLPEIKTLFAAAKNTRDTATGNVFRSAFAVRWVRNTLAVLYARDRRFEKAEMVQPGTVLKRFNNMDTIKKMIAYYENGKKTELESFLISNSPLNEADYLELLAIRYAQSDQLDSSALTFKKINMANKELFGNPFNIHIRDCHDCDHAAAQKVKYTSASFIEKMLEMKNKAQNDKKEAASNYFLVANGFYNMTIYGNARYFYSNNVDGSADWYNYPEYVPGIGDVYDCEIALKYYLLAAENSADKEFKAKCLFMASKCELIPNMASDNYGDISKGESKYYEMLIKEYSATKYYQEILKECSYFKHYVGK